MERMPLLLTGAYSIVHRHLVPSPFAADTENPAYSHHWNCSWEHWHHAAVLGLLRASGCKPNTHSISASWVETAQLKLAWTPLLSGCPCELVQGINDDFCNANGDLNARSQPAFAFFFFFFWQRRYYHALWSETDGSKDMGIRVLMKLLRCLEMSLDGSPVSAWQGQQSLWSM